ncbi:L,D-transpeptidase family protein [Paratractidigestivibacter sp.]|uniref:L,D-transpeptidase family protein n=1 Tax=Paratractidigestivibacter sp. TaxID=2847316 RepID=UPI002ABE0C6A|nr:L,D-transpeptidase family protein [Paratractidigestivibacter sp.]
MSFSWNKKATGAAFAVVAGLTLAMGATPVHAEEVLVNGAEGASDAVTAEASPAEDVETTVAETPAADSSEADEVSSPSGTEGSDTVDLDDAVTSAGDEGVDAGAASESGEAADAGDADDTDADAAADTKIDSKTGAESDAITERNSTDGMTDDVADEAVDGDAVVDTADAKDADVAEADQAVALAAENTPWYGWYTDANGVKYWYEEGRAVTEHAFYDSGTGKWYWADADGSIARNKDTYIPLDNNAEKGDWRNNGQGKWVRISDDYSMVKGEDCRVSKVDGQWHWWFFDTTSGMMLKNFVYVPSNGGKWVYYDDTYGWMVYGEQYRQSKDNTKAGYHWYYFDKTTGATTYGYKWLADASDSYYGGKTVYYDTTMGWMLYDWHYINGSWNYFDTVTGRQCASTNAAHDAWEWLNWAGSASGATNDVYVMVDKVRLRTMVFRKVNGTWIPLQDYLCTVGRNNKTYSGFWHLGLLTNEEKGITNGSVYDHSANGYGAQIDNFTDSNSGPITWSGPAVAKVEIDRFANVSYRYHFVQDQGIHSVIHTGNNEDSQLGKYISDGCVRLSTVNAKWIFDWVPMYTTIRLYNDVRFNN